MPTITSGTWVGHLDVLVRQAWRRGARTNPIVLALGRPVFLANLVWRTPRKDAVGCGH